MDALERLARASKMDKAMLTVFKGASPSGGAHCLRALLDLRVIKLTFPTAACTANQQALTFYEKIGCVFRPSFNLSPSPRLSLFRSPLTRALCLDRYGEDEIDPGRFGVEDVAYKILSKNVAS